MVAVADFVFAFSVFVAAMLFGNAFGKMDGGMPRLEQYRKQQDTSQEQSDFGNPVFHLYEVVCHKIFCNLDGIGRSAFAEIISNDPHV